MSEDFQDEAWEAFVLDGDASAEAMEACLLALEEGVSDVPDVLNTLYRAMHTVKGAARMMGLMVIEKVAHRAEDLLDQARRDGVSPKPDSVQALLKVLDYLRGAVRVAAESRADTPEAAAAEVLELLQQASEGVIPREVADVANTGGLVFFSSLPPPVSILPVAVESAPPAQEKWEPESKPDSQREGDGPVSKRREEYSRVQSKKLKRLVDLAAELGLAAHSITGNPWLLANADETTLSASRDLNALVRELRDASAALALVPIGDVFRRMKRVVRDAARELDKAIELRVEGEDTEVDKSIADGLAEPLLHLLRNAADHGLESRSDRKGAGKKEVGHIQLKAAHHGGEVVVTIIDDGRGLDRERILQRALERNLIQSEHGLADEDVWQLILEPGFSTAATVSQISGRGVGMDAVKSSIEQMQGKLSIRTAAGQGTAISLHLPLSLAFLDGLVVRSGEGFYVLPLDSVARIFRSSGKEVRAISASKLDVIDVDGELAPICWLEDFYGYGGHVARDLEGCVVVVLQTDRGRLAVPIDQLMGAQQVTMKPLTGAFRRIRAASACGLLASGAVAIALNCEQLHELVA